MPNQPALRHRFRPIGACDTRERSATRRAPASLPPLWPEAVSRIGSRRDRAAWTRERVLDAVDTWRSTAGCRRRQTGRLHVRGRLGRGARALGRELHGRSRVSSGSCSAVAMRADPDGDEVEIERESDVA